MSVTDWGSRARREAVAILAEVDDVGPTVSYDTLIGLSYDTLIGLMAMAWLQGVNLGSHETLEVVETSFARLAADLS